MSPAVATIDIWEHNDCSVTINLWTDATRTVAFDLTGYSMTYVVAQTVTGPALLTKTLGSGIVLVGAATLGVLSLIFNATDAALLPTITPAQYRPFYHELQLVSGTGKKATAFTGQLIVHTVALA